MATNILMTTTSFSAPLDGSQGAGQNPPAVSEFLTIQSLTNFSAMTGAITAAWGALKSFGPFFSTPLTPYILAIVWGVISVGISLDGLKKDGKTSWANILSAVFVALINSLVLGSAVVGANTAISQPE